MSESDRQGRVLSIYAARPHEAKALEDALEYLHFAASEFDLDPYENEGIQNLLEISSRAVGARTQEEVDDMRDFRVTMAGVKKAIEGLKNQLFVAMDLANTMLNAEVPIQDIPPSKEEIH